jgi:hypothetical protein
LFGMKLGKTNTFCPDDSGGAKIMLANNAVPSVTPKKIRFRNERTLHLDESKIRYCLKETRLKAQPQPLRVRVKPIYRFYRTMPRGKVNIPWVDVEFLSVLLLETRQNKYRKTGSRIPR